MEIDPSGSIIYISFINKIIGGLQTAYDGRPPIQHHFLNIGFVVHINYILKIDPFQIT